MLVVRGFCRFVSAMMPLPLLLLVRVVLVDQVSPILTLVLRVVARML